MKLNNLALVTIMFIIISFILSAFDIISIELTEILAYSLLVIGIALVYTETIRQNRVSVFIGSIIFLFGIYFLITEHFNLNIGEDFYVGYCPEDMASDSKAIMKLLDAGYPAAIQMKGDPGGSDGGHVITLWGYSVNVNNPNVMTGIFLSDSDDNKSSTNPPDRLFYRKVRRDSAGVWHILTADGSPYKYIKYVYGLKKK